MKILYVHIGTPKTGTTAIQNFCVKNRNLLQDKGYCYPSFPYAYIGKSGNRNGLFLTAVCRDEHGNPSEEEERQKFEEGLDTVRDLFRQYDNIILSDEGIWRAVKIRRKPLWEELKTAADRDEYTVKLIVYLRKQDDFIASLWNQRIKRNTVTKTWEEFIQERDSHGNFDYYKTLKHAADILGKENLIIRRYDRSYLKGGMAQTDFLDALGLELTDEYDLQQPMFNSSLSLNGCEIKRIVNGIPEVSATESLFFQNVLQKLADESSREYPCTIWDPAQNYEFNQCYEKENKKIADHFIRDGEPLFLDSARNEEVWRSDNPHMKNDFIRFSAGCDIALLKEIQELKERQSREIQSLKAQLSNMQAEVNMLRQFRMKIKHPFKTAVRKLLDKLKRSR